jgi:hypothetical protein
MEGVVASATPAADGGRRMFDFRIDVSSSRVDDDAASESYTDCLEYIDRGVEFTLRLPRKYGLPQAGDRIVITRSVVDGLDPTTLMDVTHVRAKLVSYGAATSD